MQYFDTLDQDLKSILESKGYKLPDTTTTNAAQLIQLQELCNKAVMEEKDIAMQMNLVLRVCDTFSPGQPAQAFNITIPDSLLVS